MNSATDPNTFIGADNQIAHLLAAPFIRDAQEITWYAAGAKDTWLRITKANGQVDIEAFERNKMALLGRALPLEEFRHRSLIPDPADAGMSEDLARNLYAIGQLAMANYDAWHRSDWKVHTATLTLLAQHVPSVADVCERAKTIDLIGAHPSQDFKYAIGQAMHELDAIEALSDDPRGLATLDPWFRAQQLVRVASKAHPDTMDARETKLYAFESGGQKSFLMVSPVASEECPGFNMWLDSAMTPLLIDYHKNGAAVYLEKPGYRWEMERPLPATMAGWNDAVARMGAINNAPFESLKTGTMHALTFEENISAIEAWANNPEGMAQWDTVDDPRAIVFLGQWALSTWVRNDPNSGQLLQGLLPEIDLAGSSGQLDPWRQLLVMARRQGINSPVDNIDLASVMAP